MKNLDAQNIMFDLKNHEATLVQTAALQNALENKNHLFWIHIDLNHHQELEKMSKILNLPEELMAIMTHHGTMPILKDDANSLTMRLQCMQSFEQGKSKAEEFSTLIIYLTENYCLTAAFKPIPALVDFQSNYKKNIKYAKTPCFILFLVLDAVINDYAKMFFKYEIKSDQMDIKVRSTHKNLYVNVMDLKKEVTRAKRYAEIIRDHLMRVSGKKINVISDQCKVSLNDLFSHACVVANQADSIRDILNGLLDQIDNTLMHKMNNAMKILTAFAAIFLPLTLISGIYGMNFHWIPELSWKYGYFYALSLMAVCGFSMLYIFKRIEWF